MNQNIWDNFLNFETLYKVSATIAGYRTDTFLKLHRALIGNKKKHQYRYRNRQYFFLRY